MSQVESAEQSRRSRVGFPSASRSMLQPSVSSFCVLSAALLMILYVERWGVDFSPQRILLLSIPLVAILSLRSLTVATVLSDRLTWLFSAFWLASLGSVWFQGVTVGGISDLLARDTLQWSILTASVSLIYFALGVCFRPTNRDIPGLLAVVVIALGLFILTGGSARPIDYRLVSHVTGTPIDHLNFSDVAAILLFLTFAFSGSLASYACAAVGLLILFMIQGRTSFYVSAGLLLTLVAIARQRGRVLVAFAAAAMFVIVTLGSLQGGAAQRMLFGGGFDADTSFRARSISLAAGLQDLPEYFLTGDINWSAERFGYIGRYVHNWLSYLHQYGFFPFFLATVTISVLALRAYRGLRKVVTVEAQFEVFRLLVAGYCLIGILVAKAFPFQWIWFAVGLYVGDVSSMRARGTLRAAS